MMTRSFYPSLRSVTVYPSLVSQVASIDSILLYFAGILLLNFNFSVVWELRLVDIRRPIREVVYSDFINRAKRAQRPDCWMV